MLVGACKEGFFFLVRKVTRMQESKSQACMNIRQSPGLRHFQFYHSSGPFSRFSEGFSAVAVAKYFFLKKRLLSCHTVALDCTVS